jgi:hypothetical protein
MKKRFWENEQIPGGMPSWELGEFWAIVDFNYTTDRDWVQLTQFEGALTALDMYN